MIRNLLLNDDRLQDEANLLAKDLSRAKLHIMLNQTDLAEHDLQSLKARVINTFDRVNIAEENAN